MADYLYEELHANNEKERWTILLRLCQGLATTVRLNGTKTLLSILWNELSKRAWYLNRVTEDLIKEFDQQDQHTAVVAIRNSKLLEKALPKLSAYAPSSLFGAPLRNAVRLRDNNMLQLIMKHVDQLTEEESKSALVLESIAFGAEPAIIEAITTDQVNILQQLLTYLQSHVSQPRRDMYTRFLQCAVLRKDTECLKALLAAIPTDKAGAKYEVKHSLFRHTCERGNAASVKVLLIDGGMKADRKSFNSESNCAIANFHR